MPRYTVVQPDGHTYTIHRGKHKMELDPDRFSDGEIITVPTMADDGSTAPLPKRQPGEHRELPGKRNTSHLWAILRFLGKDGWGN